MAALLRRHALRGASTQPRVPTAAAPTAPSRAALPRLQQPRRATGRSLSFSTAEDGTMTFYSSQSGVTVEIPAGIHLHDVGLASLGQQQGAEAEELWGTALAAYSMSDNIRSVELGEGAEPDAVAAQLTQHGETAAVVVASDAAAWGSEACQVVVRAAVGKVDGLDPDDSAQDAIDAAADAVSDVRPPLPTRPPLPLPTPRCWRWQGFRVRAFVEGAIGSTGGHTPDPYDIQSWTAELADAGCEAITLGVVRATTSLLLHRCR